MPRVIGMALGVLSLTVYFIISALVCGYLWAFIENVPLRPGDYFRQLTDALSGLDFAVLAVVRPPHPDAGPGAALAFAG